MFKLACVTEFGGGARQEGAQGQKAASAMARQERPSTQVFIYLGRTLALVQAWSEAAALARCGSCSLPSAANRGPLPGAHGGAESALRLCCGKRKAKCGQRALYLRQACLLGPYTKASSTGLGQSRKEGTANKKEKTGKREKGKRAKGKKGLGPGAGTAVQVMRAVWVLLEACSKFQSGGGG